MRISDWSSDVCSSDLNAGSNEAPVRVQLCSVSCSGGNIALRRARPDWDSAPGRRWNHHGNDGLGCTTCGGARIYVSSSSGGMMNHPSKARSEVHTSELPSLMRISYAVFCLKQTINKNLPT